MTQRIVGCETMGTAYAMLDVACHEIYDLVENDEKYKGKAGFFVFNLCLNYITAVAIDTKMPADRLKEIIGEIYNHRILESEQPSSSVKH